MYIVDLALKYKCMNEFEEKTFYTLMTLLWFKEMYQAMEKFCQIIKGEDPTELTRWMKCYWKTNIASLKTFIFGVKEDFMAVRNTIKPNITNGITDGFVNKLKTIKRNMYSKAGIELLKNKLVLEYRLFN